MTRKKVKMAWIPSERARKSSFRKRKGGLEKKMEELSILCDAQGVMIVYDPDQPEPAVWPSAEAAHELLERFTGASDFDKCRKMVNHESYLKDSITKAEELTEKHARTNREIQAVYLMDQIQSGQKRLDEYGQAELTEILWLVQEKRREIAAKKNLSQPGSASSSSLGSGLEPVVPPPSPRPETHVPQAGFPGDMGGTSYVPSITSSGLDYPGMETCLLPEPGFGMETCLLPESGFGMEGFVPSFDAGIPKPGFGMETCLLPESGFGTEGFIPSFDAGIETGTGPTESCDGFSWEQLVLDLLDDETPVPGVFP